MSIAVFLDRDGVINEVLLREGKPYPPSRPEDVRIPSDVPEALHRLKQSGFLLLVVTNQPDVVRGGQSREMVEAVNAVLAAALPIDKFRMCYHDDNDNCCCRKPQPGMILSLADEYRVDLRNSYMIGDRWRDVEAGRRAGCKTLFIDYGYSEKKPQHPDAVIRTMREAAEWIISDRQRRGD